MKKLIVIIVIFIFINIFLGVYIYLNKYNPINSIVFIESINQEYINDGMGFVYEINDESNYIVTNYHNVESSNEIYIFNINGERIEAELLYYDIYSDIAIIKFNGDLGLEPVKIDTGKTNLRDNIYYFNKTINELEKGVILSLNNKLSVSNSFGLSVYDVSEISGNIVKGNSGSPVFNDKGQIIGLLSLMNRENGHGFFIPIDYVKTIVNGLQTHSLSRPNLGGIFVETTDIKILNKYGLDVIDISGVVVAEIMPGGLLDYAGIAKGDIITEIDLKKITNVIELQSIIYSCRFGEEIEVEYYRNNNYYIKNIIIK